MKVIILGVGRSGTTALYSLLQRIMSEQLKEVEYIYEPFLWDYKKFNDKYENVSSNFKYIDSVSPEAIYNHKSLPLYIENPAAFKQNVFLNKLLRHGSSKPYLAKMIRANGRFLLLNEICSELKPVFIVRNPIDVVNSVITKFSFFGGEFHQDDFPKFIKETNSVFNTNLRKNYFKSQVEKELAFWYYMNLFAFKSFKKSNNKPFVICYDEYIRNRAPQIKEMCGYVGLKYKKNYSDVAEKKVYPVTDVFEFPKEYESVLKEYLNKYFKLLKDNKIKFTFKSKDILGKYKFTESSSLRFNKNYGLISLVVNKENEKLGIEISNNLSELEKLKNVYTKKVEEGYVKDGKIKWFEEELKALNVQVDSIKKEKQGLLNKISEGVQMLNSVESKGREHELHLEALKEKYNEKTEIINKKNGEIHWYEGQLKELKGQLAGLNYEKEILERKITDTAKESQIEIDRLKISNKEKEEDLIQLKNAAQETTNLLYKKEGEIQWYIGHVKGLKEQLVSGENLIKEFNLKIETLKTEILEKEEETSRLKDSLSKEFNLKIETLKTEILEKEEETSKFKDNLIKEFNLKIETLETEIIKKEEETAKLKDSLLKDFDLKMGALKTEILEKNEEIIKWKAEFKDKSELLFKKDGEIQWYIGQINGLKEQLASLQEVINETRLRIDSFKTENATKEIELENLRISNKEKSEKLSELLLSKNEYLNSIVLLQKKETEIVSYQNKLKELEEKLFLAGQEIIKWTNKVTLTEENWSAKKIGLELQIQKQEDLLNELKGKLDDTINLTYKKDGEIQWYQGKIRAIEEQNANTQNIILQKDSIINQQTEMLNAFSEENKKSAETIQQNEKRLNDANNEIYSLNSRILSNEGKVNELDTTKRELENIIKRKEALLDEKLNLLMAKENEMEMVKKQLKRTEMILNGEYELKSALNKLIEQKQSEVNIKDQLITDRTDMLNKKLEELDITYNSQSWKVGNNLIKFLKVISGYNFINK